MAKSNTRVHTLVDAVNTPVRTVWEPTPYYKHFLVHWVEVTLLEVFISDVFELLTNDCERDAGE
jgi:hypothetical protein